MTKPEATYLDPAPGLEDAKIRFLKAAEEASPLNPVREHPFISIGAAFFMGFGFASVAKHSAPTLVSVSQLAGAAAQIAPLLFTRARSSGG